MFAEVSELAISAKPGSAKSPIDRGRRRQPLPPLLSVARVAIGVGYTADLQWRAPAENELLAHRSRLEEVAEGMPEAMGAKNAPRGDDGERVATPNDADEPVTEVLLPGVRARAAPRATKKFCQIGDVLPGLANAMIF